MSDRVKKLLKISELEKIKSTKEKIANTSKQCLEDVNKDKETVEHDPNVGGKKRKRFTAIRYKALFKRRRQRQRIESDDDEDTEVEDKPPQTNTSRKEAPEAVKFEIKKRQHIPNVDASEKNEYNESVSRKGKEAIENINRERDEKRVSLENGYKVERSLICMLYSNPSIRSGKLDLLEREFVNKLEEHERLSKIRLEDLKATMLAAVQQVASDHEFSLRGSQHETQVVHARDPEVAPTFPENPREAQSHVEPVCEGANDIGSTISSEQNGEVPAQQVDVAEEIVDSSHENVTAPHVNCGDMEMPAGNYNKENDEDDTLGLYTSHVVEDCHKTVESAEMTTPADNEENAEDSNIRPDALKANEDRNDSHGSNSSNPVCAAISPDKTESLQPVSYSASSIDPRIAENPSDTLPPSGPLLEPIREEPPLIMPQSGENMEENLAAAIAVKTPQEEHQSHVATSVAPAPPVNALDMFYNLTNQVSPQMPNQTDPFQAEVERLSTMKDNVTKLHLEMKQNLDSECEKEIAELVAQIRLKYEAKHLEADATYNTKNMELETDIKRVILNKILATTFRSKCQDLTPFGHPGMQQVSHVGSMQQLRKLSSSPSMKHLHGVTSSSPGQSSGSQQPLQPPQPLQQPKLPQIVHQAASLFSSTPSITPSSTPNRPLSNTSSSTTPSRPLLVVNQTTSSTRPTTSRPPPRLPPNIPPPSISQINMSAANLRINTEIRGKGSHMRPLVSSEPRAPAPHMRHLVTNEPCAPAPHMRPFVTNVPRAPAPHLRPFPIRETRAPAPHIRPMECLNVESSPMPLAKTEIN